MRPRDAVQRSEGQQDGALTVHDPLLTFVPYLKGWFFIQPNEGEDCALEAANAGLADLEADAVALGDDVVDDPLAPPCDVHDFLLGPPLDENVLRHIPVHVPVYGGNPHLLPLGDVHAAETLVPP